MNWSPSNSTTTKVPLWRVDCEAFYHAGKSFELRDVTAEEHHCFIATFSNHHNLQVLVQETTARFQLSDK